MSDRVNIIAEPRSIVGKKVKLLRRQGWIPAVIYGKSDPIAIQVEDVPLRRALRTAGKTEVVDLEMGGEKHAVLVREIQKHVTRGDLIHVDFWELDMTTRITAEAQLVTVGQSTAEIQGAAVLLLRSVELECLPDALLDEVAVDLSLITMPDDVIYMRDLVLPEGVDAITDGDTVVARFEKLREEIVDEEEEISLAADSVETVGEDSEEDSDD